MKTEKPYVQISTSSGATSKSIDPRFRTHFYKNELLSQIENETVEYKNYHLPLKIQELSDNIKRQICGFLNNQGGRLYIGINDSKKVIGVNLSDSERDKNTNDLINLSSDFYPKCRNDKLKVYYIPIKHPAMDQFIPDLWVVKIVIKQGQTNKLYSVTSRGYKSFMRLQGQCVELTAIEVEELLINRYFNPKPPVDETQFIDPDPEIPTEGSKLKIRLCTEEEDAHREITMFNNICSTFKLAQSRTLAYNFNLPIRSDNNPINDIVNYNTYSNKIRKHKEKENSRDIATYKPVKVSISNLNKNTTKEELLDILKNYSLDYSYPIVINKIGGDMFVFAVVYFTNKLEAIKAKSSLDGEIFNGNRISIKIIY